MEPETKTLAANVIEQGLVEVDGKVKAVRVHHAHCDLCGRSLARADAGPVRCICGYGGTLEAKDS